MNPNPLLKERSVSDMKSQIECFKEAASEFGTDDEERFNEELRKLAKQKPDDKKPSED